MLALIFPGQGSQKPGMGEELFDSVPEYSEVEGQVNDILGFSVRELCLNDDGAKLGDTRYTQPALYVVNSLYYYKVAREGPRASYLAGHSLGEYNALVAAGVFDFITGLRMVKRRGELMAATKNGGMAAVIGLDDDSVASVMRDCGVDTVDIANVNSPYQTVVSGPNGALRKLKSALERAGTQLVMPLPVSGAFHSRYMKPAAQQFAEFLEGIPFRAPRVPVVANATSSAFTERTEPERLKRLLVSQMIRPVRWMEIVRYLLDRGVTEFKEVGPGNVLTNLVKQVQMADGRTMAV